MALTTSSPVFFGYVILGLGYGLYMHNLGFSFWYPTLMAATIYGGSVEFIIATLLTQHFNPLNVLLITAVVGFRQFFYGISMLTKYPRYGWQKLPLLFGLTDETFVINYSLKVPAGYDKTAVQVWISALDYFYWVLGAFLGGFLGSTLNLRIKGLDFVMTALFIVLAVIVNALALVKMRFCGYATILVNLYFAIASLATFQSVTPRTTAYGLFVEALSIIGILLGAAGIYYGIKQRSDYTKARIEKLMKKAKEK